MLQRQHRLDEDRRVKYEAAIELAIAEGERVWNRFNILCVLNTALVAGLVSLSDRRTFELEIFLMTLCGGLAACIIWWSLNEKGFAWYQYFIARAQALEADMSGSVDVVGHTMNRFRQGGPVKFLSGDGVPPVWDNTTSVQGLTKLMIGLFGFVYVGFGIWVVATRVPINVS